MARQKDWTQGTTDDKKAKDEIDRKEEPRD